jgi:hypothetical protein
MKYCVKLIAPDGKESYLNVNNRTAWILGTAKRHREEFLAKFPRYQAKVVDIF